MTYLDSSEYTTYVVDVYWSSSEYEEDVFKQATDFYEWSCAHVLCQLHHLIPDKALPCRIFEGSYANPNFKSVCDFILFTQSELAEIAAYDEKEGRHWSPPALASPTLEELCERLRGEAEVVETATTEATPVAFSASAEAPAAIAELADAAEPAVAERVIVFVDDSV